MHNKIIEYFQKNIISADLNIKSKKQYLEIFSDIKNKYIINFNYTKYCFKSIY